MFNQLTKFKLFTKRFDVSGHSAVCRVETCPWPGATEVEETWRIDEKIGWRNAEDWRAALSDDSQASRG